MCVMKYWKCFVKQVVWGVGSRVGGKRASWNQEGRASSPWVQGSSPAPSRARAWPASCPRGSLQGREQSWIERTLTLPSPRLWLPLSSRSVPQWKPDCLCTEFMKSILKQGTLILSEVVWWATHGESMLLYRLRELVFFLSGNCEHWALLEGFVFE